MLLASQPVGKLQGILGPPFLPEGKKELTYYKATKYT